MPLTRRVFTNNARTQPGEDWPRSAKAGSITQKTSPVARTSIRVFITSLFAAIILFFLYERQRSGVLPESYALCSPDGKIYTVDPSRNITDCILVHGKLILATGSLAEIKQHWLNESAYKNMSPRIPVFYTNRGFIIVPGMSDSHAHILEQGKKIKLDLDGLDSPKEAVEKVREYIESRPDILNDSTAWVDGGGWDHTRWPHGKWPTSADLDVDPIVRGRPVVLLSKDGHAFWCSETAITLSLPFPSRIEGGVIFRDNHGQPTGVLLDKAMDLITRPPLSESRMLEYFYAATDAALAHGLTAVHDAGLNPLAVPLFQKLAETRGLPIRIYAMRFFNETEPYWGGNIPKIIQHADYRFTARSVKIFMDGALRTGGAALYEPYWDNSETRGFFRTSPEVLGVMVPRFLRDGWQVNTHCIGDRANGMFLDLMEELADDVNITSLRPRLEHAQIIAPGDFSRLGKLGVISSVQPSHVIDDMWFTEDRLGPERIKGAYAFRSMLNNSAPITLGSDFPIADLNPLTTFYAAITRVSIHGKSPHGPSGWKVFPEQRLTRHEALKGITLDPAFASFSESILGSLTPGKRADYVILSKDILTIPAPEILGTRVIATVLDGRIAFGKM